METVSACQTLLVEAPAWYCFERYADVASYPSWEKGTRNVEILEEGAKRRPTRIFFEYERRVLGLWPIKLRYSLRAEYHSLGSDAYWIKFDDARGDLRYALTVVEFLARDPGSTILTYKTVIGDPYRLRRSMLAAFAPAEIRSHLNDFAAHVRQTSPGLVRPDGRLLTAG